MCYGFIKDGPYTKVLNELYSTSIFLKIIRYIKHSINNVYIIYRAQLLTEAGIIYKTLKDGMVRNQKINCQKCYLFVNIVVECLAQRRPMSDGEPAT